VWTVSQHDHKQISTTTGTTSSIPGNSVPRGTTIHEFADNRNGSPVFADPTGRPIAGTLATRIPFGTVVDVTCKAPNQSGSSSISAFYHIADGPWKDYYVVADTMSNGGPLGNTDSPNVDPRVPDCP
jgi:hypothetical protein